MQHRLTMAIPNQSAQSILQGGAGDLVAAGQQVVNSVVSFIFEMAMVAGVVMMFYGVVAHLTRYSKSGTNWLINGILLEIVVSCLYMWLLGANGPPDISIWFRPPA